MVLSIDKIYEDTFEEWFLNRVDPDDYEQLINLDWWNCGPFNTYYPSEPSTIYQRFGKEIWEVVLNTAPIIGGDAFLKSLFDKGPCTPRGFELAMVLVAVSCMAFSTKLSILIRNEPRF
jgi:hypothetical protein